MGHCKIHWAEGQRKESTINSFPYQCAIENWYVCKLFKISTKISITISLFHIVSNDLCSINGHN